MSCGSAGAPEGGGKGRIRTLESCNQKADSCLVCGGVWDEQPVPVAHGEAPEDPTSGHGRVHHRDHLITKES